MGVHGITTLLQDRGCLPNGRGSCCSTSCWKEEDPFASEGVAPSMQRISPLSTFLIDGNGLAFYLHKVAYARHIRSVTHSSTCPLASSLSPVEITRVLPGFLPLDLLKQTTVEYVASLRKHKIKLQVYWDGPSRRFKALTNKKRRLRRQQDWGTLQQYALHGSMPKERQVCQWHSHFPYSALFLKCVRHALQICFCQMVDCQEEADVELARRASGDPNAYVLGQDSDFFFYKDIQYIPLDSIYVDNSGVQAGCWTRSGVAQLLGLEDEDMVELAILMGNDFVDPATLGIMPINQRDPQSIINYLREQDAGFQVEASKFHSADPLDYVRCLYDLQDLARFPLDGSAVNGDANSERNHFNEIEILISFPQAFPSNQAKMLDEDAGSVRDAVIRCLQVFLDQSEVESGSVLKQAHLDAYKASTMPSISSNLFKLESRPRWKDVKAAYIIETCVARILRSSPGSFVVSGAPPDSLINHLVFHAILCTLREAASGTGDISDDEAGDGPTLAPPLAPSAPVERVTLPIDEYESQILETIKNNRVTIIHGETGCGKSSRVPIMLLQAPSPEPSLPDIKFFMSQPRRIAAKALVERVRSCEPDHRDKFALRMGHGWREYETNKTQAWFVTTGYLTRLLANHPERFDDCTHLIIDEVHERSVDTDILCLLCRRLLERNSTIRLVLMSATLATKLYQDYFGIPNDPIHVGVRCFPIQEYFVEDLKQFKLPKTEATATLAIQKECESRRCNSAPSQAELTKRFSLAARLTTIVGKPGSSVLIFVPGMNEIVSITECIENFYVPGTRYTCYPIHSDIPFDSQMDAFTAPEADEVKVIIATNAAESSVTLPAVDHVICLGLCRQIMYNESSHRQVLTPCWISRASATQRAGRTGRVRPGNVYRLYTRHAYESYMEAFEPGEMVRIPLDAVILMLKQMLHEEVKPVLLDCIEPPRMDTIDRSFQSLHRWSFITEPDDQADITTLGAFVSTLGIDLTLGSVIGLGIQFGVAAEAIEMAAIMSFPKTPFQITNPLYHEPAEFNEITSQGYVSKCHFDANLYSEPMALMNVIWDYQMMPNKSHWCLHHRIAIARLKQLVATRNSLRKRVADFFGINEDKLQVENPPAHMSHAKVTILRLLQVWVFSETIIECPPTKIQKARNGSVTLSLKGNMDELTENHMNQVLDAERHPYKLISRRDIEHEGNFDPAGDFNLDGGFDLGRFVTSFEKRLVSYMCATRIDLVCCYDKNNFFLYFNEDVALGHVIGSFSDLTGEDAVGSLLRASHHSDIKRRGILERKCGMWDVQDTYFSSAPTASSRAEEKKFRRIHVVDHRRVDFVALCELMDQALDEGEVNTVMYWEFSTTSRGKKNRRKQQQPSQKFSVILRGDCSNVAKADLQDLLGTTSFTSILRRAPMTQAISFPHSPNHPCPYKGKDSKLLSTPCVTESSTWNRPVFEDIPEGARVLSVVASGLRKGGHRLRFTPLAGSSNGTPQETVDVALQRAETEISKRWRRFGTDTTVYVHQDTVPASATHTSRTLFACSSNSLEIASGGIKVDGLTLLPPNPLFVLLAHLTFGLEPSVSFAWDQMGDDHNDEKRLKTAMRWLHDRQTRSTFETEGMENEDDAWNKTDAENRVRLAIQFHKSCAEMGEELVCFPKKIQSLCALFDSLDGYDVQVWDSMNERTLTSDNLRRWKNEKRTTHKEPKESSAKVEGVDSRKQTPSSSQAKKSKVPKKQGKPDVQLKASGTETTIVAIGKQENKIDSEPLKWRVVRTFSKNYVEKTRRLFATELENGEEVSSSELPSTNILCLLFQAYYDHLLTELDSQARKPAAEKRSVLLNAANWEIHTCENPNGSMLYYARFINDLLPVLPIVGRGKNKLPKWAKKHMRPHKGEDAKSCVPPNIICPEPVVVADLSKDRPTLVFDSIEAALRMEAAFYLERQFSYAGKSSIRHWYDHNFQEMIHLLQKHHTSIANGVSL